MLLTTTTLWYCCLLLLLPPLALAQGCPAGQCPNETTPVCLDAARSLTDCARTLCGCLAQGGSSFTYKGNTTDEAGSAFLALPLLDGQGVETRVRVSSGCDVKLIFSVVRMNWSSSPASYTKDMEARVGLCADSVHKPTDYVQEAINNSYSARFSKLPYQSSYVFNDNGPLHDVVLRHRWARPCRTANDTFFGSYVVVNFSTYQPYAGEGDCLGLDLGRPFWLYPAGVCGCATPQQCAAPLLNFSQPSWALGYQVYTNCQRNWTEPPDDSSSSSSSSSDGSSSSSSDGSGLVAGGVCPPDLCPAGSELRCQRAVPPGGVCSYEDCRCRLLGGGSFTYGGRDWLASWLSLPLWSGQGAETRVTVARGCNVSVATYFEAGAPNATLDPQARVGVCSDNWASEHATEALSNPDPTLSKNASEPDMVSLSVYQFGGTAHDVVLRHRWARPCPGTAGFMYLTVLASVQEVYQGPGDCVRIDVGNPFQLYSLPTTGGSARCNCQGAAECAAPTRNFSSPPSGFGYPLYSGCENRWNASAPTTTTAATTAAPNTSAPPNSMVNTTTSSATTGAAVNWWALLALSLCLWVREE